MKNKKFNYAFVIVIMCFLLNGVSLGFCSSNKSLYLGAITGALDIDRSLFAINDTCRFLATSIINLFCGKLVSKWGNRKLVVAGALSLILSVLINSRASMVVQFWIGGIFLGIGFGFCSNAIASLINRWCKNNTGKAMGFVYASNGVFGAIAAQIVSPLIEESTFGYRNAYKLIAILLSVVGILCFIFIKERPSGEENVVDVVKKKKARNSWVGIPAEKVLSKSYFYVLCVCIFFTGVVLQGINGIAATHMRDSGINSSYVATVLSIHSLSLALFKFLTGVIYDKKGLRFCLNSCYVAGVIVFVSLSFVNPTPIGMFLAMVYGIFSSMALPLETIIVPFIAGDLFGNESYEKLLGYLMAVNHVGYAIGAPVVNLFFTLMGTYKYALLVGAIILLCVAISMQFVMKSAYKEKQLLLQIL